jgi:hypothetical protein
LEADGLGGSDERHDPGLEPGPTTETADGELHLPIARQIAAPHRWEPSIDTSESGRLRLVLTGVETATGTIARIDLERCRQFL